jgi:alcohol dehydrogenase class IV
MQRSKIYTYQWPGRVLIGTDAVKQVAEQVQALGVSRPFVLCDPGVAGLLGGLTESLAAANLSFVLYDKVIGNPDAEHSDAAGQAFIDSHADCVIGFGGGSALDMAKVVRLLAGDKLIASSAEYMSIRGDRARPAPPVNKMPPMIAIPTTAGTGSEVTPWGVITDHANNLKSGIGGVNLIPNVALIDPEMTVSLPPFLTAATGMDALSHLIEAFVSTNRNPMLDSLILRGIELVGKSLRLAVQQPENRQARLDLMEAAMLGGIALSSNYLGACHSLAHQLSTFADMHHGLACAIMLPPQMAFSLSGAPNLYAAVARALSPESGGVGAEDAPALVHQLNLDAGLPVRLRDAGVSREVIPTMAEFAKKDLNWTTNPRQPFLDDMQAMYEQVF